MCALQACKVQGLGVACLPCQMWLAWQARRSQGAAPVEGLPPRCCASTAAAGGQACSIVWGCTRPAGPDRCGISGWLARLQQRCSSEGTCIVPTAPAEGLMRSSAEACITLAGRGWVWHVWLACRSIQGAALWSLAAVAAVTWQHASRVCMWIWQPWQVWLACRSTNTAALEGLAQVARSAAQLLDQYYHVFYEELELAGQLCSCSACQLAFFLRVPQPLRPGTRRWQGSRPSGPSLALLNSLYAAKKGSIRHRHSKACSSCSAAAAPQPVRSSLWQLSSLASSASLLPHLVPRPCCQWLTGSPVTCSAP